MPQGHCVTVSNKEYPSDSTVLRFIVLTSLNSVTRCQPAGRRSKMKMRVIVLTTFVVLAVITLTFLKSNVAGAAGEEGWRLTWSSSGGGAGSRTYESGIPPYVETFIDGVSFSGSFGGTYLTDMDGNILSGSFSGDKTDTVDRRHLGWPCGFEDLLQIVESHTSNVQSETISAPTIGGRISISEGADTTTGKHIVYFSIPTQCTGFHSWSNQSFDVNWCTPINDSGSYATNGCTTPIYYSRGGQLEANDDTNLTFSSYGSEPDSWYWSETPVGLLVTGIRSWEGHAEKIIVPVIHGIEFTQAIQIYQPLDTFLQYLANNDHDPPVPIVAYKPLAIRIVLDKPPKVIKAIVEVYWNGKTLGEENITQSPSCNPNISYSTGTQENSARESLLPDCRTADFIVDEPEEGENNIRVVLKTDKGELVKEYNFVVRAKKSDTVVVGAVNVCASKTSTGKWDCLAYPVRDLRRAVGLMKKLYPTDAVVVEPTGHQVRLEIIDDNEVEYPGKPDGDQADCYDRYGVKVLDAEYVTVGGIEKLKVHWYYPSSTPTKCEKRVWWDVAALRINRLYTLSEQTLEWLGGLQYFFYGLVKHQNLFCFPSGGCIKGKSHRVDENTFGRGALGITKSGPYDWDVVKETAAHEIAHLFGRTHTNKIPDYPCPPAIDHGTDYPSIYPDEKIYSGQTLSDLNYEVGFDPISKRPISPYTHHSIMSYCSPYWITPFTYLKMGEMIDPPPPPPPGVAGEYWLISGFVDDDVAYIEPIFRFSTVGPVEAGTGSHRIELQDEAGNALYARHFTPTVAHEQTTGDDEQAIGLSTFDELVPVQPMATKIVVINGVRQIIGEQTIGGAAPDVSLSFPVGGEQLEGGQTIRWTVDDSDSSVDSVIYWVQYSADGGSHWLTLAQDLQETSMTTDFDFLPGSSNNALIRILATDGINTGSATSSAFSVNKKDPMADILVPEEQRIFKSGEMIFFEGQGYDLDDGVLPKDTHVWSSSIDGDIGVGYEIAVNSLSEGQHIIKLTVTDSDGKIASDAITITIRKLGKPLTVPWIPLLLLGD